MNSEQYNFRSKLALSCRVCKEKTCAPSRLSRIFFRNIRKIWSNNLIYLSFVTKSRAWLNWDSMNAMAYDRILWSSNSNGWTSYNRSIYSHKEMNQFSRSILFASSPFPTQYAVECGVFVCDFQKVFRKTNTTNKYWWKRKPQSQLNITEKLLVHINKYLHV